jgi:glycine/D-amino acid oxidase-like deaminating enzyme
MSAIVGGGIAGLTAALLLAESGREVVVLEADRTAEGVSGYTTAKLTAGHGLLYSQLRSSFGANAARHQSFGNSSFCAKIKNAS